MPESDPLHTLDTLCHRRLNRFAHRHRGTWTFQRVHGDFDFWKPPAITREVESVFSEAAELDEKEKEHAEGMPYRLLCLYIQVSYGSGSVAGTPTLDWFSSQASFSSSFSSSSRLFPTVNGQSYGYHLDTLPAFLCGLLYQRRKEKWDCRRHANVVALSQSLMADHVIVIIGDEDAVDLEALAESGVSGTLGGAHLGSLDSVSPSSHG